MQTKIGKKSKKSYCKKREKMIKSKHKSQKKEQEVENVYNRRI